MKPDASKADSPMSREISHSRDLSCRLSWYPPDYAQARHAHARPELSLLYAGGFREAAVGREKHPTHRSLAAKPAGAEHAVTFGSSGALILSFSLSPSIEDAAIGRLRARWIWYEAEPAQSIIAACLPPLDDLHRSRPEHLEDVVWDLLAAMADPVPATRRPSPPIWLRQVREALDATPAKIKVGETALETGVHRSHLARLFRGCYGVPISVYRRRALAAEALRHLGHGRSLAAAADAAGFADQAHMTRAVKAQIGATPGKLRRLLLSARPEGD